MANTDGAQLQVHLEDLTPASSQTTLGHARELLLEYGHWVLTQPGAASFCFGSLEREAADLPCSYLQAGGGGLIAYARNQPVGFVAWRSLDPNITPHACEMKRLWVRPIARGLSLGRTLSLTAIERARAAGYTFLYLDTAPASMTAAYRLYLDLGFQPCPRYNDNQVEDLAFLRKAL